MEIRRNLTVGPGASEWLGWLMTEAIDGQVVAAVNLLKPMVAAKGRASA